MNPAVGDRMNRVRQGVGAGDSIDVHSKDKLIPI